MPFYAPERKLFYRVSGKNAHDARLVAVMKPHGITRILTFNAADFARYPAVTAMTGRPSCALSGQAEYAL